ncbi:unnamed protein product [Rotaria sp. Silwood1]|nr:unnamed protein product [Rotaria sp. Silwood1]
MTIPQFLKPLNTVLFTTTISDGCTAVFETTQHRGICHHGGFNGVTTIFNVECFDDLAEEWYDAADMNIFRSALSACILSGFDYVRNLITFARKQIIDEEKLKNSNIINKDTSTSSSIIAVGTLSAAVGALSSTIDNIITNNL